MKIKINTNMFKTIINKITIIIFLIITVLTTSCEESIPIEDNGRYTEEFVFETPTLSRGVLLWAYAGLPTYYYGFGANEEFLEVATDDATSGGAGTSMKNFATGMLSPANNLIDNWNSNYNKIKMLNLFLEKGLKDQLYIKDTVVNKRFMLRYKAEALTMRAWCHYELLRYFGGQVNGEPMGIPVLKRVYTDSEAIALERPTYLDCVKEIVADCDSALKEIEFPEEYVGNDLVNGQRWYGAANKKVARMIKVLTYLQAASPAFNKNNDVALWDSVARNAMLAIKAIDGTPNADALPVRDFYTVTNNTDVIWARPQNSATSFNYETKNLPPSLRGSGQTNPSQELVDAFYDALGYPISESQIYNPQNPYIARDNRLRQFILLNGSVYSGQTIETFNGGVDAPGSSLNASRTGYYLLKFLSPDAVLYPEKSNGKSSYVAMMSKTDLYLIYAEAMNELAGPLDTRYDLSAKDALSKIRKRAGFIFDPYLAALTDKTIFRNLVQNERRVELCFEGKRFWDLRRWGKPVNTKVSRVVINKVNDSYVFEAPEVVENKLFSSPFMPIPMNETILIKGLKQNDGWSN